MLKYYFHGGDRQKKASPLISALESNGWKSGLPLKSDAVFVDSDTDKEFLNSMYRRGRKIFIFPHAARPNFFNDFDNFPISPFIMAGFVLTEGHVEIERIIGINYPLEVIGWYLCELQPFQKRESYRKVLFAPIHPNSDNSLSDIDKQINADAFRKLLPLARDGEIDLTVRHIRKLEDGGLWRENGVTYKQVEPNIDTKQINGADVVVSHQTFAHLAIARGVPTVMMGEGISPRIGCQSKGDFRYANSWEKYKHLLMYPLDILAVEDTAGLLQVAINGDEMIADWKARLIGKQFDADYFVKRVESYL